MIDKAVRETLKEYGERHDVAIEILENPSFDKSIIAITNDNRLVYDYHKMVREMMKDDKCNWETAVEFIEVNTIRDLAFRGSTAPIIVYGLDKIL